MKKIILTILCGLLFTVASKAQTDSLEIKKFGQTIENHQDQINDLYSRFRITSESHEEEIQDINLRLNTYTKHYFTGVILVGFGSILTGAAMYSYDRAMHRKAKLEDRGWTEVEMNTADNRDLRIDYLLDNDNSIEFIKEWGIGERPSIIK